MILRKLVHDKIAQKDALLDLDLPRWMWVSLPHSHILKLWKQPGLVWPVDPQLRQRKLAVVVSQYSRDYQGHGYPGWPRPRGICFCDNSGIFFFQFKLTGLVACQKCRMDQTTEWKRGQFSSNLITPPPPLRSPRSGSFHRQDCTMFSTCSCNSKIRVCKIL